MGCAEGRMLKAFLGLGCRCWGVEHPSYPSRRFLHRDRITYLTGDIQTLPLQEASFDLIFLWHVLEHLEDPDKAMDRLCELLTPEGVLVLAVPNFKSLEAKGFKQAWFHLDIPWHIFHFSEQSLSHLAKKHGLHLIEKSTLCMEQGPYGLLQSLLNVMGWPRNELYEAFKGNLKPGRALPVVAQLLMSIGVVVPASLSSLFISYTGKGSILRCVFTKAGP